MDLPRRPFAAVFFLSAAVFLTEQRIHGEAAVLPENLVFEVRNKFAGRREKDLGALRAHDVRRHARLLSAVDLPLGGDSEPESIGLYFTKIRLGTPARDFYVQVDTGSDILWVNCAGCIRCPRKSDMGLQLTLYDKDTSSTAKSITCDDKFCSLINEKSDCRSGSICQYVIVYGDHSSTSGYFVRDIVHLDLVTGNLQTGATNGTLVFGCGSKQSGQLGESGSALDGIMGFGQSNSSFISQLAAQGKVKRAFAHCLDNNNGGGVFAIGEVVSPKVKNAPMVPHEVHYSVVVKAIQVGNSVLEFPSNAFDAEGNRGAIIDSGTTLAYLPDTVYEPLLSKILVGQPGIVLHSVQDVFSCFHYTAELESFPSVTFEFENSLSLTVYPQEYLFETQEDIWCFGWQNGGGAQTKTGGSLTILGDMAFSNKLVVYDIEKQVIGWTNHNCSEGIQVKDEASGSVYTVGAHNLSSSSSLTVVIRLVMLFSLLIPLLSKLTL